MGGWVGGYGLGAGGATGLNEQQLEACLLPSFRAVRLAASGHPKPSRLLSSPSLPPANI